ncbi:MAG TPA: hypothetical protein VMJ34_07975 [Bryobacteraceae bacterium]|nr:hypothetical protein [Bryobacteraceae bacterium]
MTWEAFYLFCFVVGFVLTVVSFLGAAHIHVPHLDGFHIHVGHGHGGGAHGASVFNFPTITAFIAWFGGTGYLLTRYSSLWYVAALLIAGAMGTAGGAIVFWFLVKVLLGHERDLVASDYEMTGVLGKISSGIRAGGTGEMIYSQEGVRRSCGARSEMGTPIAKGTEVVVTRYERGIAYVRPWEELAGMETNQAGPAGS